MTASITPAQPRAGRPSASRARSRTPPPPATARSSIAASRSTTTCATRTAEIIQRVRRDGDRALRDLAYSLDGVALEQLEVPRAVWRDAAAIVAPELRAALERAARNIRRAHEAWRPTAGEVETEPGVLVGRRPDPLERVGMYAPGGRALYPSSVLMGAIPARVAGVGEIVMCSPPGRVRHARANHARGCEWQASIACSPSGAPARSRRWPTAPNPSRVSTASSVPGNAYVAAAKLQVASDTSIDAPAGPSELLVIADDSDAADAVAREVVAQAEHDPDAAVIVDCHLVPTIAAAIGRAVQCLVPFEKRADIIAASLNA